MRAVACGARLLCAIRSRSIKRPRVFRRCDAAIQTRSYAAQPFARPKTPRALAVPVCYYSGGGGAASGTFDNPFGRNPDTSPPPMDIVPPTIENSLNTGGVSTGEERKDAFVDSTSRDVEAAAEFPLTPTTTPVGIASMDPPTPDTSSSFKERHKSVSFDSLGVCTAVSSALSSAGFERPTGMQIAAIPELFRKSRDNVIIAGPTGSGKTLAYLAPILSDSIRDLENTPNNTPNGMRGGAGRTLILCPNPALARQAYDVLESVIQSSPEGHPVRAVTAMLIEGDLPPMQATLMPQIVVAPTAKFHKFAAEFGGRSHQKQFIASVSRVIIDEADLQLSGSHQADIRSLMSYLRVGSLGHPSQWYLRKFFTRFLLKSTLRMDQDRKEAGMRHVQLVFSAATLPATSPKSPGSILRDALPYARTVREGLLHRVQPSVEFRWTRVDDEAEREPLIEELDPFHHASAVVDDKCSDDDDETLTPPRPSWRVQCRVEAVAKALRAGPNRAMVFVEKGDSADWLAETLARQPGVARAEAWHRGVSMAERHDLLTRMRRADVVEGSSSVEGSPSDGVLCLVCTDAAARGIDLPRVGHVVQAEFALNAVEFLHRVGRTGRLGRPGVVTSLVDAKSADLAGKLRASIEKGGSLEGAFSRKRSFRKNINRSKGALR